MKPRTRRWALLIAASHGLLFASTCDSVLSTIGLAFDIVRVWV